jgi:hypothetical protein
MRQCIKGLEAFVHAVVLFQSVATILFVVTSVEIGG